MLQNDCCKPKKSRGENIGEQGGGVRGVLPRLKKFFYDPPLRFKMTPTPSEMAFDPL